MVTPSLPNRGEEVISQSARLCRIVGAMGKPSPLLVWLLAFVPACGSSTDEQPKDGLQLGEGIDPTGLDGIDLSDARVQRTTLRELWQVGVTCCGWPSQIPADASKDSVHQQLLMLKYAGVGDFPEEIGYGGDGRRR